MSSVDFLSNHLNDERARNLAYLLVLFAQKDHGNVPLVKAKASGGTVATYDRFLYGLREVPQTIARRSAHDNLYVDRLAFDEERRKGRVRFAQVHCTQGEIAFDRHESHLTPPPRALVVAPEAMET